MTLKKWYQISIFIAVCIILNYAGKEFAKALDLPLWLDSFGTILTAYALGPFCGAVVGLAGNLVYGLQTPFSFVYGITSIFIGIIVGITAKKKVFDTLFGAMTVSVIVTVSSIIISTPLNWFIHDGDTGNIWGNGVVGFLQEQGLPKLPSVIIGEFYIDFLDKVIISVSLYGLIKLFRVVNRKKLTAAASIVIVMSMLFAPCRISKAEEAGSSPKWDNQYLDYVQTIFSSNSGLPCGTANDVAETDDGILWIGTYAGLYRYNGSEFRWMSDFESVRNVNCLYVDEEGRLWIGTNDNGLSICINEDIINVIDEDNGLVSNSVRCIINSADGYYYVGTSGSMQVLSLEDGLSIKGDLPEVIYASGCTADDFGNVAAVTSSGDLFLMNDAKVVDSTRPSDDQEVFTCCKFDKRGFLYAGTSEHHIYVFELSESGMKRRGILHAGTMVNLNNITFEDEKMFVCADNGVGYLDDSMIFHEINTNEFNNSIDRMTMDYQGNLWFASSRLGLLRLTKASFSDAYSTIGMEKKVVNTVSGWNDALYIGTDTGLDIVDSSCTGQITNDLTEYLKDTRIRCIRSDADNNLWICTYGKGLIEVSPSGEIKTYDSLNGKFGDWARVVITTEDNSIVAAGDTGVAKIKNDEIVWMCKYGEGISNSVILSILERSDGTIYAGSDGDGITVIKDGKAVKDITRSDGLSSGVILRMTADEKDDGIYVVTSNGLCYIDKNDSIRTIDNFPYYNNYDIWNVSNNELFVLSSAGIYVVDRDELLSDAEEVNYELLDAKKGLSSALTPNSWNYCDEKGILYLSPDSGLFKIDTRHYAAGNRSYRMRISTIKLDNETNIVERGAPFIIGRGTGRIEIFPEVINPYVSYYLEGFDTAPTVLSQKDMASIVYTNLPNGTYTFSMKVLGNDRETVLEESVYEFVKEKEIYDNQWFRIYMLIVAMLAVAWFTWLIVRTQIQRTLNLQKKELSLAKQQLQMGNETILAIAKTVDAKDSNTSQHSLRVAEYAVYIAREMGFSDDECENLRKAAMLHDIGKIGIPDRILNKPDRLTDEEYAVMKSHVTRGADILKEFTLIDHVVEGALYHHERYDGKGYVQGLSGDEIPIYGRIIGVADAFDAMTATRIYRKKLDIDFALGELRRGKGLQFDPEIVDIMVGLIESGKLDIYEVYKAMEAEKGGTV